MLGVQIVITRYLSDDPQPGIVECILQDAHTRQWVFVEKTALVSRAVLTAHTSYPQPGIIACTVLGQRTDATGRTIMLIDTDHPWHVASLTGVTQFAVWPDSLVEWSQDH